MGKGKMAGTVFFSWQSDRPSREGRNLIEKALETAVARINKDLTVEEAERPELSVDKDTRGVPGSPPIFQTILAKIDKAAVFVADLTFCGNRVAGGPTPNPNVLIEYGWALKSVGHLQVVTVMNEAHGEPSAESMPFHLAHLRFPITYKLADDAPDGERRLERAKLADDLEKAVRGILESAEFKAKLPTLPTPPPFPRKEPLDGKARFRERGKPLGTVPDSLDGVLGAQESKSIYLAAGPAIWLRIMPSWDSGRRWRNDELREALPRLGNVALLTNRGSGRFVRGKDGCGYYPVTVDEEKTYSACFVFETGEMWIINTIAYIMSNFVDLNEPDFIESLDACAAFLSGLGCVKPYWWQVGMEGVEGHYMSFPNLLHRIGPCLVDVIEAEGFYKDGDSASGLLSSFFEEVYDRFGTRRPSGP
jgi:hypothetical protein